MPQMPCLSLSCKGRLGNIPRSSFPSYTALPCWPRRLSAYFLAFPNYCYRLESLCFLPYHYPWLSCFQLLQMLLPLHNQRPSEDRVSASLENHILPEATKIGRHGRRVKERDCKVNMGPQIDHRNEVLERICEWWHLASTLIVF
jgi:hypothetical protein